MHKLKYPFHIENLERDLLQITTHACNMLPRQKVEKKDVYVNSSELKLK
jgi:hypothetical protein